MRKKRPTVATRSLSKEQKSYNKRLAEGKRMYLSGRKLRSYTGPSPAK